MYFVLISSCQNTSNYVKNHTLLISLSYQMLCTVGQCMICTSKSRAKWMGSHMATRVSTKKWSSCLWFICVSVLFSLNTFLILRLPTIPNQIIVHFYKLTVMSLWYLARLDHSYFLSAPPCYWGTRKTKRRKGRGVFKFCFEGDQFCLCKREVCWHFDLPFLGSKSSLFWGVN